MLLVFLQKDLGASHSPSACSNPPWLPLISVKVVCFTIIISGARRDHHFVVSFVVPVIVNVIGVIFCIGVTVSVSFYIGAGIGFCNWGLGSSALTRRDRRLRWLLRARDRVLGSPPSALFASDSTLYDNGDGREGVLEVDVNGETLTETIRKVQRC